MSYSPLQWMGPELARSGLVRNEDWVVQNVSEAVSLFGNQGLHVAATVMAAVHPRSIDYITQAPVLVVAACNGTALHRRRDREFLARRWRHAIEGGPRVRDVLKSYGLTNQHRAIKSSVLAPSHWPTLQMLSAVDPSTLAQAIPTTHQFTWLRKLGIWSTRMQRRYQDKTRRFAWAALAIGRAPNDPHDVADLADFAGSPVAVFDERWSLQTAQAAAERWHVELRRLTGEQQFFEHYGVGFSEPIDYGALPVEREIGPLRFLALRSGEDLYAEGVAMHHCVSTYSQAVINGRARIYSVRDKGGKRLATLELAQINGTWAPVQFKGPCNRRVIGAPIAALNEFIEGINE